MAGSRTRQREVKKIEVLERQGKAFEMRKRGHSYRDIAEALGISYPTARRDVKNALQVLHEETMEEAASYRTMQVNRMMDLLQVQTAIAVDTTHKDYQAATEKVLKIEGMIMKLMGTEELPIQRIESTNNDAVVIEYVETPAPKDEE